MICYVKGAPPAGLTAIVATPGSSWSSLGAADRGRIREALARDQGNLCAYCQRRIRATTDGPTATKIEHWEARSTPDADRRDQFRWNNLLGVCPGISGERQGNAVRHCDSSRGNAALFLHPVEGSGPSPREYLQYTRDGEVLNPRNDPRVERDINALNLNARTLRRARETVFDAVWERLKMTNFSVQALRREVEAHRLVAGSEAPPHAEFVRYHVLKKLRSKGIDPASV